MATDKGSLCKGDGVAVTLGPGDHRNSKAGEGAQQRSYCKSAVAPSRLQQLVFRAGRYQNQNPKPDAAMLRVVSRFTALTELYLCHLCVDEKTLQVTALTVYPVC